MARLLVLGHSDSDGSRLPRREDGLTWVLQRRIEETAGVRIEAAHRAVFAGPTALRFVERQMDLEQPDIVVLATSGYGVVVELASNRVRERFGDRAARAVNRAEVEVSRAAIRLGPRGQKTLRLPRRVARTILGTAPALSFEDLVSCYHELFRALARREQVHTIILSGLGYGIELQRLNPRLNELQNTFHARLRSVADELHFDWVSHEGVLGGPVAKLKYMQADGVHSNEESQRLAAEALVPLVLPKL